ncbi:unnamed protein product [Linum tenue]|uniref:non-specific serine/threonine protein kinase n=1 Tax=Linum tenue TaxID=586396 RepID=A0AAV0LYG8_9ROSI|nr:unnamed protein product [Linum tenue]
MAYFKIPTLFLLVCSFGSSPAGGISNQTDEQALLDFKSKITSDPLGIFSSWTNHIHFCKWAGVTCDNGDERVTRLDLSAHQLQGTISPSIANLTSLRQLLLHHNSFTGEIPPGIGVLASLQVLHLNTNFLTGEIPRNVSAWSDLIYLNLGINKLVGKIPDRLDTTKLRYLNLESNNLTGGIPPSLGNISSLETIGMGFNSLGGTIPESFGRLERLSVLSIGGNSLTGIFPLSIYNISSIVYLSVPLNQLQGTLPAELGNVWPNLAELNIGQNRFTGAIPASLANASNLERLTITDNGISGTLPSFEKLQKLWWLSISYNLLGTGEAGDLDFISSVSNLSSLQLVSLGFNNFGGSLPESVVNFTEVSSLRMKGNKITGRMPRGMSNLKKLEWLELSNNQFSGSVPEEIGELGGYLKRLYLQGNRFSEGRIPSSFGNLTQLTHLDMEQSSIQGEIPSSLGNCRSLLWLNLNGNNLTGEIPGEILSIESLTIYLGLAENRLTGSLPRQVGTLKNLGVLNVSHNLLSGEIPASLGSCVLLEALVLQNNSFQGVIPSSLSSLKGIQLMDLANNNFTGEIPQFLGSFRSLTTLNLSFNRFHGRVPDEGLFRNSTAASVTGNGELCGGISELHLPPCTINKKAKRLNKKAKRLSLAIIVASIFVSLALFSSVLFLLCIKRKNRVDPDAESSASPFPQVSYHSLRKATEEFSPRNLVRTGSFGCVYKGIDPKDGKVIAVKVLNLLHPAASKSFRAECEVLRTVRHRNLLKLLTSCSSIDTEGNEFKALVYEFMPNGSLEEWLHHDPASQIERKKQLNLLERLNVAIDVASALEYLHHGLKTPIVHCDLKPSNVLLNHEMTGVVGDFGLARLFPEAKAIVISRSLSCSFGVEFAEYGTGNEVSTSGDVYSYGMLLLELFTGRRPTDEMFEDGLNLNLHAKVDSWEEANEILDVILLDEIEETMIYAARNTIVQECVLSILRLGVAASTELPEQRMSISDIALELLGIKGKLVKKWVPASKQKTYWTSTSVREDGRNLDICTRNTSIQDCEAEI